MWTSPRDGRYTIDLLLDEDAHLLAYAEGTYPHVTLTLISTAQTIKHHFKQSKEKDEVDETGEIETEEDFAQGEMWWSRSEGAYRGWDEESAALFALWEEEDLVLDTNSPVTVTWR